LRLLEHLSNFGSSFTARAGVEQRVARIPKVYPSLRLVWRPSLPRRAPVNVAFLSYGPAGFLLSLYDQRQASVAKIGDTPVTSNFEVGRYQLTPAALRALETTIADAIKNYKNINGVELPTREQMIARDQTSALEKSLPQFKPPDPPPLTDP
jgi:hypothetical protein